MSEESIVGSKAWSNLLKKKVINLSGVVTKNYVELAKLLYLMDRTTINNDSTQPNICFHWHYNSLREFASKELALEVRKFNYILSIGYTLEETLKDADPELMERFINLGWSKVREICRVVEKSQFFDWVNKGEQSTFSEIQDMVSQYRKDDEENKLKRLALAGAATLNKDPFGPPKMENMADLDPSTQAVVTGASFDTPNSSAVAVMPEELELKPTPIPEMTKMTHESFAFYEDQSDIVKSALKRAEQLSGSTKKSNNLTLICTEFLATNEFTKATEEQRLKFLASIEKSLGFKLIAADPETNGVVYGIETLQTIARNAATQEQEQEEECTTSVNR